MEEFLQVYSKGVERRNVSHTDLNDVSSRSHAVLSIRASNDAVTGKLNLIDLAGKIPSNGLHTCIELIGFVLPL
jgi:kinesin family protein 22